MTSTNFKKLCNWGKRFVRFDVLPYQSLYPDASEKDLRNKYVYFCLFVMFSHAKLYTN